MNNSQIYVPSDEDHLFDGIYKTSIPGLLFIKVVPHIDDRGFFSELVRLPELNSLIDEPFNIAQLNLAKSKTNVARGFHKEEWAKLVMVLTGECLAVMVDVRPESPTFGHHVKFHFGENSTTPLGAIYIPNGMANGYLTINGPLNYFYCFNALYKNRNKSFDMSLSLFDPDLNIDWPIPRDQFILSHRDTTASSLRELFPEKFK